MKKLIFSVIFILFANAATITVKNGIYPKIDFKCLQKYSHNINIQSSFDNHRHLYTIVFLSRIQSIYCPFSKKITFVGYDDYAVTFSKKEIDSNQIVFAYKEDNMSIPIDKKGPAKIIYIQNRNPLKEIFLIKELICH